MKVHATYIFISTHFPLWESHGLMGRLETIYLLVVSPIVSEETIHRF